MTMTAAAPGAIAAAFAPAVRRSPLEATHAALRAQWVSETAHWPQHYGNPDAERDALGHGIALADVGPFDKLLVKGPGALAAVRSMGLDARAGTVQPLMVPVVVNAWSIADDEVLLVLPAAELRAVLPASLRSVGPEELTDRLRRSGPAVTDVSSGFATFRLIGPGVGSLLEEACAVDLSPAAVPDLAIVQTTVAGDRVILGRRDHGPLLGFVLALARDDAQHLWDALLELGQPFGIQIVGGLAATPPAIASVASEAVGAPR
jgi:heterotetrameric sarcosine oxidase gamma subunit